VLIASNRKNIPDFLELKQLKNYRFIFREKGSGTRNIVEKYLKEKGVSITPSLEINSSRAIAKIVEKTDYLAFVSKLVVQNEKNIRIIGVKGLRIKREFYIITQKNIRLPKLERIFLNFLLSNHL